MAGLEGIATEGNSIILPDDRIIIPEPIMLSEEDGISDAECAYDSSDFGPDAIKPDSVSLVLARRFDNYLAVPPAELQYLIPNLVPDPVQASGLVRKMIAHSSIIQEKTKEYGLNLILLNNFGFVNSLDRFHPGAIAFFKLYDPRPDYLSIPQNQRRPMMSVAKAVDTSLVQLLPGLIHTLDEYGYQTKIYIFETEPNPGMNTDDHFRMLLIESPLMKQLRKIYSKHPRVEFVTGKDLKRGVEVLAKGDYRS
ncbi:MAG: hypothetical protein KKE20_02015 [Nanoarchaeota archaeon]|nr:hypothetical protein [Nanoarchaeota archaeon]